MISSQGIPKLNPNAVMKDLNVIGSGFRGLEFVYLMVGTMGRLFTMVSPKKGRMLAPFP